MPPAVRYEIAVYFPTQLLPVTMAAFLVCGCGDDASQTDAGDAAEILVDGSTGDSDHQDSDQDSDTGSFSVDGNTTDTDTTDGNPDANPLMDEATEIATRIWMALGCTAAPVGFGVTKVGCEPRTLDSLMCLEADLSMCTMCDRNNQFECSSLSDECARRIVLEAVCLEDGEVFSKAMEAMLEVSADLSCNLIAPTPFPTHPTCADDYWVLSRCLRSNINLCECDDNNNNLNCDAVRTTSACAAAYQAHLDCVVAFE